MFTGHGRFAGQYFPGSPQRTVVDEILEGDGRGQEAVPQQVVVLHPQRLHPLGPQVDLELAMHVLRKSRVHEFLGQAGIGGDDALGLAFVGLCPGGRAQDGGQAARHQFRLLGQQVLAHGQGQRRVIVHAAGQVGAGGRIGDGDRPGEPHDHGGDRAWLYNASTSPRTSAKASSR